MFKMPEHFRWNLKCKGCPAGMEADGHSSMATMDAYLSSHIEAFGHKKYDLTITTDEEWRGKAVAVSV